MKGMRNITLIAAMVLTLAAFGCSSTNDQVVDNADGNLGAATVPTGGIDADSRTNMSDSGTNSRVGTAVATNQVTPSVPSQGLALPDNRPNTVATTTQVAQSTTTYNTPITTPSTTTVDTSATMSTETVPEPAITTTTTTTTVEERNLRETTTTDQSMASSAQTDTTTTTEEDTTTRRRMRKD